MAWWEGHYIIATWSWSGQALRQEAAAGVGGQVHEVLKRRARKRSRRPQRLAEPGYSTGREKEEGSAATSEATTIGIAAIANFSCLLYSRLLFVYMIGLGHPTTGRSQLIGRLKPAGNRRAMGKWGTWFIEKIMTGTCPHGPILKTSFKAKKFFLHGNNTICIYKYLSDSNIPIASEYLLTGSITLIKKSLPYSSLSWIDKFW